MISKTAPLLDAHDLARKIRSMGYVVTLWSPEDMAGFGNPAVPLCDRLDECRKALEDASHGWDVIGSILGQHDDNEEEG